jgi:NAD(P)-dependent dehydrogenase (short-subunit alcohol dehydrogenase family)
VKSYQTVIIAGASSSGIGFAMAKAYLDRGYNVVGNVRTLDRLEAAAAFGKVDILVNNAGIFIAKPLADYTEAEIEALIDTNIKGFLYPSQQAATHMAKNKSGHIVTITASLAMQPTAKVPSIMAILVKGGLNSTTRGLAIELAGSGVKVNAVAPGIILTPLHGDADEGTKEFLKTLSPSGNVGNRQDVVDAVLYLTDSTFTSGTVLPVDGGATVGSW